MVEVLLDWRGDEFVDEARLATDLGSPKRTTILRRLKGSTDRVVSLVASRFPEGASGSLILLLFRYGRVFGGQLL